MTHKKSNQILLAVMENFYSLPACYVHLVLEQFDLSLFPDREELLVEFLANRYTHNKYFPDYPRSSSKCFQNGNEVGSIGMRAWNVPRNWFSDYEVGNLWEKEAAVPTSLQKALVKIFHGDTANLIHENSVVKVEFSNDRVNGYPFSFISPLIDKLLENDKIIVEVTLRKDEAEALLPPRVFSRDPFDDLEDLRAAFPQCVKKMTAEEYAANHQQLEMFLKLYKNLQ